MSIQPVHSAQTYSPVKKAAKTVAKAAVVSAAVAATLALGAKNGKFAVNDNTNKVMAKVLPYLEKAGNFINDKAGKVADKISQTGIKEKITGSKVFTTVKGKAEKIADEFSKAGIKEKITNSKVFTNIKETAGKVEEYLRTNIGKFNPDKANAADKAAETFNNFVQ